MNKIKFIIVTLLLIMSQTALAATITVSGDCSASAVQTAINSASGGDTIDVTCTGTVTWSSGITLSGGKTLKGGGAKTGSGRTGTWPLNINVTTGGSALIQINNTTGQSINRVTGFKFSGTGNPLYIISVEGKGTGTDGKGAFRVDNNYFNEVRHSSRLIRTDGSDGKMTGLLDHNVFYYKSTSPDQYGNITYINTYRGSSANCSGYDSWKRTIGFGSSDFVFYEDNYFLNTFLETSDGGGRVVVRYNEHVSDYDAYMIGVDGHGADTGQTQSCGIVANEVYNNTFTGDYFGQIVDMRGGQWRVYNNTLASGILQINEYRLTAPSYLDWKACSGTFCCPTTPAQCNIQAPQISDFASCYPVLNQVQNTFLWNNIKGGSNTSPTFVDDSATLKYYVALNRDYWMPTYGTEANLPATCTAGANTFYGATDSGKLWNCDTTNHWTLTYTPYTYPHPLLGGTSEDTTAPTVSITQSSPQVINTNSLAVSGTASDDVGVTSCKYRIGSPPSDSYGTLLTGTTTWSGTVVSIPFGPNTLYVGCRDEAGNWGSSYIGLIYSDNIAPTVTFTTTSPQSTTKNLLQISGTASDSIGVSSCKYRVGSVPDATHGTALSGTTSWSGNATGFLGETNTLYVGCTDSTGNWGSAYITVNYYPSSIVWGKLTGVSETDIRSFSTWTVTNGTVINQGLDTERVSLSANGYMVSGVVTTGLVGVRLSINKYTSAVNQTLKYKTAVDDVLTGATWTTYTGKFNSLGFVKLCVTVGGSCGE